MGSSAYTVERDFCVPRANLEPALAAVNAAFDRDFVALAAAVELLTCFEDNETDRGGAFVLGRHQDSYVEDTEKLLAVLAPFAMEGSYVRFDGQDGDLWGFRVVDGRLREESGDYVWTLEPLSDDLAADGAAAGGPRPVAAGQAQGARVGGSVAPLVFSRDPGDFEVWWAQVARRDAITELFDGLGGEGAVEDALHGLMLATFQANPAPPTWLRVDGLRAGVTAANLQLDIDPYRDSEGILDGVEVVVALHVGEGLRRQSFTASQYVRHPAQVLVRESAESPVVALAELVDAALAVVNERIAELDRFTFGVRAGAASIDGSVSGHG